VFNGVLAGYKKAILLAVLVLLFFGLMSRMDYIVNSTLYSYGLRFSYNWAWEYWITYNAIFIAFALVVSFAYWFGSHKTRRDMKFSFALLITIVLLAVGGLQDVIFFVFWGGGLPPSNVVWWWVPWINLIGTWNSVIQIIFTTLAFGASICTWLLATKKPRQ
jgi:hypothetical protein